MKKKSWLLAIAASAVLAGCLGDPDSTPLTPPATSQVPAGASTSIGGFISYLQALVASPSETLSPVDTSMVTPPTDETSSPLPVN